MLLQREAPEMSTRGISVPATRVLEIFLLAMTLGACRQPAKDPVTLSYVRLGWSQPDELPTAELLSEQFTRETGIRLRPIPVPENTLDQLGLSRRLLEGASGPDVLGVDVIWSGVLQDNLLDLQNYVEPEISLLQPQLVSSYAVDGKLGAIPYQVQIGVLEYRTDLLRKYGYDHPPRTWDELERMAERIQTGERARGDKDFWGYVWQGAAGEGLTCNALEWQASEGGGRIIEDDRTISVNNPAAIRSWQRAKRWIGWISPPSVVAYHESDSMNAFDSREAAFDRVWGGLTDGASNLPSRLPPDLHQRSSRPTGKTGYTSIPGGPRGRFGTLGGSGLSISAHSLHPQEAAELVRFLIRAQTRTSEDSTLANQHEYPEIHELPAIFNPQNGSEKSGRYKSELVRRPSTDTGKLYEQVARAYFTAVHSVLTGERGAPEAAAELEKQLVAITHFRTGPPKTQD